MSSCKSNLKWRCFPLFWQTLFSVTKLCLTRCDPMDYSMPGSPVLHCPPVLVQTHIHRVGDALKPSHSLSPLSSCPESFPASVLPNEWVLHIRWHCTGASTSASVLPVNIQDWSPLGWTVWISLQSKGLSRVFSSTTVWKHHSSAPSLLYGPALTSVHD